LLIIRFGGISEFEMNAYNILSVIAMVICNFFCILDDKDRVSFLLFIVLLAQKSAPAVFAFANLSGALTSGIYKQKNTSNENN
jgi:hypothetical protein